MPATEIAEDQVELEALHREQSRRDVFRFSMVDIPVGSTLTFSKDETITAHVVDDKKIEFEGQVMTTSAAAVKVLQRLGGKLNQAQGPLYWMYEGETLVERRIRLETDADQQ